MRKERIYIWPPGLFSAALAVPRINMPGIRVWFQRPGAIINVPHGANKAEAGFYLVCEVLVAELIRRLRAASAFADRKSRDYALARLALLAPGDCFRPDSNSSQSCNYIAASAFKIRVPPAHSRPRTKELR
jgi:hypothetical protein